MPSSTPQKNHGAKPLEQPWKKAWPPTTEKKAGEKIKNAAQGLFTFATYGVGMFIGTWFSGFTTDYYTVEGEHQWQYIWYVPAFIAVAVLLYFILFFREKNEILEAK